MIHQDLKHLCHILQLQQCHAFPAMMAPESGRQSKAFLPWAVSAGVLSQTRYTRSFALEPRHHLTQLKGSIPVYQCGDFAVQPPIPCKGKVSMPEMCAFCRQTSATCLQCKHWDENRQKSPRGHIGPEPGPFLSPFLSIPWKVLSLPGFVALERTHTAA